MQPILSTLFPIGFDSIPPDNQHGLPQVISVERQGSLLHPSPIGDDTDVLSLNLTRGCAHRCPFCSVRSHATYPGDDSVYLFANSSERLAAELARRRRKPRAVFVSPATDPFPPLAEVQAETARIVEVLAGHGIETWLMTRGYIRPAAMQVLTRHRQHVKVTLGLTTLDRARQRLLEPLAAPPRLRLRQIAQLQRLGIKVQVAIEPLVPGLTDTHANLVEILEALAAAGIRHITAGYMFLRSGIADNLQKALEPHGLDQMVLDAFAQGPVLQSGTLAPARYLPKTRRQRGYAALMALAAEFDITVGINSLTNPDFLPPRTPHKPAPQRLLPRYVEVLSKHSTVGQG